ncbi:hypothetical protein QP343_05935 [Lactobacillus jensenii]|jgi:hypothetical protein|uniref:Uncharacterized protein n=1 Tax=Lactobacillus jensenii TaxID=109790 RepID=A0ABU9FK34_LACJE|nr:hypothetical protein [Lactobacillus jensenii]EEX27937.1 hypothetical protein HMPREF0527_00172 [Lactobacillus jensenii SJ-7A-US]MBS5831890.1 hypothetical protein [Lactobacillus jensenii]MCF1850624.1 hypothetical protein [Lactobacillus jensenii]MCW8070805.1 hypothetical protein [Lactobacillus jensenii]MCW8115695.1 hypothetical protein [Lactobacillus jensenii]
MAEIKCDKVFIKSGDDMEEVKPLNIDYDHSIVDMYHEAFEKTKPFKNIKKLHPKMKFYYDPDGVVSGMYKENGKVILKFTGNLCTYLEDDYEL